MSGSRLAILVDFDDTAAAQNAAEAMLDRFADGEWTGLRERFRQGALTLREYQECAFNSVRATLGEMEATAADLVALRPGLAGLKSFCDAHGFHLAIVTNSLDFYVRGILSETALHATPLHAVVATGDPGHLSFHYPHAVAWCKEWGWGNCKCRVLAEYRLNGTKVVYVGDGRSDLCVARQADFVFARSTLLDHCRALGLPHREFSDFTDVVAALERNAATGWIPPGAPGNP